jgi:23S rRNA pseudouridine1911/1915/1917 synthase
LPRLLTRLDRAASGIVLAALSPAAEERFRRQESAGLVQKSYYALVRGVLEAPLRLCFRLVSDRGERALAREEEEEDAARHTVVEPLGSVRVPELPFDTLACSLVRVLIKRGARHQIRAHLAHAGFPLLGEWLYAPPLPGVSRLYLHHAALRLPGFAATCPPAWDEVFFDSLYRRKRCTGRAVRPGALRF